MNTEQYNLLKKSVAKWNTWRTNNPEVLIDLSNADFYKANLSKALLHKANLSYANLSYAHLNQIKGLNKLITSPLYMLLDQPGYIRAYKLVNEKNEGPVYGGITFNLEKEYTEKDANTNENEQCGRGINLASLDWSIREWKKKHKILIVEFKAEDIAAIPIGTDGKFRVRKCKVVGEKNLKEIGLE